MSDAATLTGPAAHPPRMADNENTTRMVPLRAGTLRRRWEIDEPAADYVTLAQLRELVGRNRFSPDDAPLLAVVNDRNVLIGLRVHPQAEAEGRRAQMLAYQKAKEEEEAAAEKPIPRDPPILPPMPADS